MTMATNAREWLRRHAERREPPADQTRPFPIVEALETGDVLEDGSILCEGGLVLAHGRVYLTARKVRASNYYGWVVVPMGVRVLDGRTGQRLYLVKR